MQLSCPFYTQWHIYNVLHLQTQLLLDGVM